MKTAAPQTTALVFLSRRCCQGEALVVAKSHIRHSPCTISEKSSSKAVPKAAAQASGRFVQTHRCGEVTIVHEVLTQRYMYGLCLFTFKGLRLVSMECTVRVAGFDLQMIRTTILLVGSKG